MAATIKLGKGAKVSLTKNSTIRNVEIGLGWVVDEKHIAQSSVKVIPHDLDLTAFLANKNRIVTEDENIVFYGNGTSLDGAVVSSGDNRSGGTEKDAVQETITVELDRVARNVEHIIVVVTIDKHAQRRHNFGQLSSAFISITDLDTGDVPYRYELDTQFATEASVTFIELSREGNDWELTAIGQGFHGGLEAKCKELGIEVE